MLPNFYEHCAKLPDGLDLLFAHRWILLCFKREFPERGNDQRIIESPSDLRYTSVIVLWFRSITDVGSMLVALSNRLLPSIYLH